MWTFSIVLPQRPPLCINSSRNGAIPKSAGTSRSLDLLTVDITRKNVALCDATLYSLAAYVHRVVDNPATSVIRVRAVLSLTTWAQLYLSVFICKIWFLVKEVNKEWSTKTAVCLDMPRLNRWLRHFKPLWLTFYSVAIKNTKINLIFCPDQLWMWSSK
jgi:hypothetical protein